MRLIPLTLQPQSCRPIPVHSKAHTHGYGTVCTITVRPQINTLLPTSWIHLVAPTISHRRHNLIKPETYLETAVQVRFS